MVRIRHGFLLALGSCGQTTAVDVTLRFDPCVDPRLIYRVVIYLRSDREPSQVPADNIAGMVGTVRDVDGIPPSEFLLILERSRLDLRDGMRIRLLPGAGTARPLWVWAGAGDANQLLFARASSSEDPIRTDIVPGEIREVTLTFGCVCPGMSQCGVACARDNGCNPCLGLEEPFDPSSCGDLFDNDCDGLMGTGGIDCADPGCAGAGPCSVTCPTMPFTGVETACDDGVDDDCNGLPDCLDPACSAAPSCCGLGGPPSMGPLLEQCANGIDDDCDGLVDGDDSDCRVCASGSGVEICDDRVDNDGDGLVDCDDPDCACTICATHFTTGPEICNDGIDNDLNGLTDCVDPYCCGIPPCNAAVCAVPPPRP